MQKFSLVACLFVVACGSASITPNKGSSTSHHSLIRDDAGMIDLDAGNEDAGSVVSSDARTDVAACAGAALDKEPMHCSSSGSGEDLITTCNTGLSIKWNCDKCGDVEKNGSVIGHVLMTSDTRFEVTAANKMFYVCQLDSTGFSLMRPQ